MSFCSIYLTYIPICIQCQQFRHFTSVCGLPFLDNYWRINTLENCKLIFVNIYIFTFCPCTIQTCWKILSYVLFLAYFWPIRSLGIRTYFLHLCFQHSKSEAYRAYRRKYARLCYQFLPPPNSLGVLSLTLLT